METHRETLGVVEAGSRLGLSRGSSYRAAKSGQLPCLRFGKRLVVPLRVLEKMLESGLPASEVASR